MNDQAPMDEDQHLESLTRLIAMAATEARRYPRTNLVAHFLDIALMELSTVRRAADGGAGSRRRAP